MVWRKSMTLKSGMKHYVQVIANRLGYEIHKLPSTSVESQRTSIEARSTFTEAQIRKMVGEVPFWWHTIRLPYGVKTPGFLTEEQEQNIAKFIPADLSGKTVLDIGTWDGYYAFCVEARGASRVIAIDSQQYEHLPEYYPGHPLGIEVAKKILGSKVDYKMLDVSELDKLQENADLVLFFGVYYHLENPFLALRKISEKTRWMLMLEGDVYPDNEPTMKFYHAGHPDKTCWWNPSKSCLELMLKEVGFSRIETVWRNKRILMKAAK
jgi:tRNA (mo5U34)-methyltransferase